MLSVTIQASEHLDKPVILAKAGIQAFNFPGFPLSWERRNTGFSRFPSVDSQTVKKQDFELVTIDSTVQEKAITYPTDGKLYERCRQHLVRLAEQHEIPLRQNYNRKAPYV